MKLNSTFSICIPTFYQIAISYNLYVVLNFSNQKQKIERIKVKISQGGAPALCDNHFVIASVML